MLRPTSLLPGLTSQQDQETYLISDLGFKLIRVLTFGPAPERNTKPVSASTTASRRHTAWWLSKKRFKVATGCQCMGPLLLPGQRTRKLRFQCSFHDLGKSSLLSFLPFPLQWLLLQSLISAQSFPPSPPTMARSRWHQRDSIFFRSMAERTDAHQGGSPVPAQQHQPRTLLNTTQLYLWETRPGCCLDPGG